ncbi:hypothetical protein [Laspinema palackyanum]|uniref:hypothetical protein n=1 Tax=Laspinema palackyanum TaxID=3231601 RepID=UPI00345D7BA9|nr:hypothetical protein [Laspinema sp. D2c]
MASLNFRIDDTGEIRAATPGMADKILRKALIGDSSVGFNSPAVREVFSDYANWTEGSIPVNDKALVEILDKLSPSCDRVFLSPSTELHGFSKFEEINAGMDRPWDERFLTFSADERIPVASYRYSGSTEGQREIMRQNFLEIVGGLMEKYPNLYLVPVLSRFLSGKIPHAFQAYSELQKMDRCIALEFLDLKG